MELPAGHGTARSRSRTTALSFLRYPLVLPRPGYLFDHPAMRARATHAPRQQLIFHACSAAERTQAIKLLNAARLLAWLGQVPGL